MASYKKENLQPASAPGSTKNSNKIDRGGLLRPKTTAEEQKPCLLNMLKGHKAKINALAFHPYVSNIISGSEDGMLMLWKFSPGNHDVRPKVFRYEGHSGPVNDVSFLNDGSMFVSCSSDHSVRVWTPVISGGRSLEFKPHTNSVRSISCHPKNIAEIATASDDKIVKVWNITRIEKTSSEKLRSLSHEFITSFSSHKNWVKSVRYSPDGNLLCTSSDDQSVRVFDIRNKSCVSIFNTNPECPTHADFNPCADQYIGMTTIGKKFQIFDRRNCKLIQSYNDIQKEKIHSFVFHPSGDFAFCVSEDSSTKVLDLIEGRSMWTYYGHKDAVRAVAVSKSGDILVTAGDGKELLVWELNLPSYDSDPVKDKQQETPKGVQFDDTADDDDDEENENDNSNNDEQNSPLQLEDDFQKVSLESNAHTTSTSSTATKMKVRSKPLQEENYYN